MTELLRGTDTEQLLQQIDDAIKNGTAAHGAIPEIKFTIHARAIPGLPMDKPAKYPTLKSLKGKAVTKTEWQEMRAKYEVQMLEYKRQRGLWALEKRTVARLTKIRNMVAKL